MAEAAARTGEELKNFVVALLAMLPSRNYVAQIIRLLYETGGIDRTTFQQMYRGIIDLDTELFLRALGVRMEKEYVKLKYMSTGWMLAELYDEFFKLFEKEDFRKRLMDVTGMDIPDLLEEWLFIRIDTILKDPAHGRSARIVLRRLLDKDSVTVKELVDNEDITAGEAYAVGDALKYLGIVEHIDGIIRLAPRVIENRDRFERVLQRLGVV